MGGISLSISFRDNLIVSWRAIFQAVPNYERLRSLLPGSSPIGSVFWRPVEFYNFLVLFLWRLSSSWSVAWNNDFSSTTSADRSDDFCLTAVLLGVPPILEQFCGLAWISFCCFYICCAPRLTFQSSGEPAKTLISLYRIFLLFLFAVFLGFFLAGKFGGRDVSVYNGIAMGLFDKTRTELQQPLPVCPQVVGS